MPEPRLLESYNENVLLSEIAFMWALREVWYVRARQLFAYTLEGGVFSSITHQLSGHPSNAK